MERVNLNRYNDFNYKKKNPIVLECPYREVEKCNKIRHKSLEQKPKKLENNSRVMWSQYNITANND